MNAQQDQVTEGMEKLKEIPKWTRRYAQNRTLTILVLMVMTMLFGAFFAALIGFPLILAAAGFRKGNIILGCVGIVVLVAGLVACFKCLLILNRKFGGKNRGLLVRLLDQRIYGKEGTVSTPQPKLSKTKKCLDIFVGIVSIVCFLGSMELAMIGYLPVKYLLPFMALFVVPLGLYQYFTLWPRLGPVLLIYPILYAIHAILIIAGLPIFFTGIFAVPLNMLVPITYNLLAYVIGHLYSRYALKKLKTTAHLQDNNNG